MGVLEDLDQAVETLKQNPGFCKLIPEVATNIAYAKENASELDDVAAIPGRIRPALGKPSAVTTAHFGASSHMARTVLRVMQLDPTKRCCMNIKYSEESVEALKKNGYTAVFFDRMKEPDEIKSVEGRSVPWVVEQAYKELGKMPDAVYDKGAVGKEPMIRLIAENPKKAVEMALGIL